MGDLQEGLAMRKLALYSILETLGERGYVESDADRVRYAAVRDLTGS